MNNNNNLPQYNDNLSQYSYFPSYQQQPYLPNYVPFKMQELVKSCEQKVKCHTRNDPIKDQLDPISIYGLVALLPFKEGYSNITYWNDFINGYRTVALVQSGSCIRRVTGQSHEDLDIIGIATRKIKKRYIIRFAAQIREITNPVLKGLFQLIKLYAEDKGSGITTDGLKHYKSKVKKLKNVQPPNNENVVPQENNSSEECKQTAMLNLWSIEEFTELAQNLQRISELEDPQKRKNTIERVELLISQKQKANNEIWSKN